MPRLPFHHHATCALLFALTAVLAGCEHEASRDQAATGSAIRNAEDALFSAGNDQAKLERAIGTTRNIRSGTKQQQANRNLMLASAQVRLGQLQERLLDQAEMQMRHDMMHINTLVDAVHALQSFVDQRRTINVSQLGNVTLQSQHRLLSVKIHDLDAELQGRRAPVQAIERKNDDQMVRIRDLRRAAEALRQEQANLGPLKGFEIFKKAVAADDEADSLELEIARRQIQLDLETQPNIDTASLSNSHMKEQLNEVGEVQLSLSSLVQTHTQQADAARSLLDNMNTAINVSMRTLNEQNTGTANTAYDTARGTLEEAASDARTGARATHKDSKNSASLLQSQANILLFQIDARRLRGLEERILLLKRLAASNELSDRETYALQLEKAKSVRTQLLQTAKAAGEEAINALGGVRGGEVDQIRTDLQDAMQQLGIETAMAQTTTRPPVAPPAAPAASPPPAPSATDTPMFDTAQGLVDHLNTLTDSNESDLEKFAATRALTSAETPAGKKSLQDTMQFITAFQKLMSAANAKFGNAPSPVLSMIKSQIEASISKVHITELKMTTDTTAEVQFNPPMGESVTIYLIKTQRGWLVNEDENLARNPEVRASMEMMPTLIDAFNNVANQIESGAITNPMGVDMALGQAMGGAGAPGGRP
jgi:hypothetical protein